MAEGVLAGLKVVEGCQMAAGPYCAKLMADLGAQVVKVEEPGRDDEARRRGLFFYLNTNKLGITLNMADLAGKKLFLELIPKVDILVEDSQPQVKQAQGLDYESLSQLSPRLIMISIGPFGQTGPYRNYRAYPMNTYHSGGEGYMTPLVPLGDNIPRNCLITCASISPESAHSNRH